MEYAIMGLIVLVLVVVLKQPRSIEVHFHNPEEKPEKGELSEEGKAAFEDALLERRPG